jgi:16S rRNA (cytidine1402-2'-O)-methyltransferase
MNHSQVHRVERLAAGLYFVATPIGTARDITLRALDILASADVIAAEDTRNTRKLMDIHGILLGDRQLVSYHDHNGEKVRPKLIAAIEAGKSVAYASDAGTPLVADPGYGLMRGAIEADVLVTSAPGPSAVLAALTVAGLPNDRFTFAGFVPNAKGARRAFLSGLAKSDGTMIVFESPKRIKAMLEDLSDIVESERQIAVARELTKRFEEVLRGTVSEVQELVEGRTFKGEMVVMLDKAPVELATDEDVEAALKDALAEHSLKDAAVIVADMYGRPKREIYQQALVLHKTEE